MNPWTETLTAALKAIPCDVDGKAIRKVVSACLKDRKPCEPVCPHKQLIDLWCKAFLDWFKCDYVFLAKDAAAVKKLLVNFEVEQVMRIAKAAWSHRDTYPCSMALTLPKLLSHINEIREWLNTNHGKNGKGQAMKMPTFKQLEILRASLAQHPCNPRSISYNPDSASLKSDYSDLKRKIAELEASERQRVLA